MPSENSNFLRAFLVKEYLKHVIPLLPYNNLGKKKEFPYTTESPFL